MANETKKTYTVQKLEELNENVSINSSQGILRGQYSNAIKIATTDSETTIDFAYIFPIDDDKKQGEHVARIIVNNDFAIKMAEQITKITSEHKQKQKKQTK